MKPTVVSADVLFDEFRVCSSGSGWPASRLPSAASIEVAVRAARSGADWVGYLNYIHPYRVQILGEREVNYLTKGTPEDCAAAHLRIVDAEPPVLILPTARARGTRCCLLSSARRSRCSPPPSPAAFRHRRAACLSVQALRRPHLDARRVHGIRAWAC